MYNDFTTLLSKKNESELIQFYRDLAEEESERTGKEVNPIDLIDSQIKNLELRQQNKPKKTFLKRIIELSIAKERLQPQRFTENRILNRDYNLVDRSSYANIHFQNEFYTDFKLKNKNLLRLRFLHPDPAEHISGADLIYEQYDLKEKKVRFIFLQYKTWENNIIYKSQADNMEPQLVKLQKILCKNSLCHSMHGSNHSLTYRLPYCAAFLRPTDKMQVGDNKMMSTGYHLPVCTALKLLETEGKINKKSIGEQSFKSQIFEDLFNSNMIGSRWIDVEELEKLYKENNMFKDDSRIKIYALELLNEESQMIND